MSIDLSLDRLRAFWPNLPREYRRPTVHIAGTNGKGSVSAIVSSILRASDPPISVGRYNSPHLTKITDCITLNDEPIDYETYYATRSQIERLSGEHQAQLTPFEVLTLTALQIFEAKQVDIAVIEVGMGGRLDATNIIPSECILVSALTTVDLDHTQFLGTTIDAVAREKLGIARPGKPFVLGKQRHFKVEAIAHTRLQEVGAKVKLPVGVRKRDWDSSIDGPEPVPLSLHPSISPQRDLRPPQPVEFFMLAIDAEPIQALFPLSGEHQLGNLSTSLGIVESLLDSLDSPVRPSQINAETLRSGIANVRWRGRLSWHSIELDALSRGTTSPPSPLYHPILVDGAHNAGSSFALANYVREVEAQIPLRIHMHYILGISASPTKSPRETLTPLLSNLPSSIDRLHVALVGFSLPDQMPWVRPVSPNTMAPIVEDLAQSVENKQVWVPRPKDTSTTAGDSSDLVAALRWVATSIRTSENNPLVEHLIVLAGSLYLVAEFYRLLDSLSRD